MSYAEGIKGENYFSALMNSNGIKSEFIDSWFDFEIKGLIKVEIKTCGLTISNGGHRQTGMYEFTKPENRELQYKNNVWVCLLVQHQGQFLIQGFIKAKHLKQKQHLSIVAASRLKLKTLEQFINIINN